MGYRSVSVRDETDASVIAESLRRPQAFAAIFDRHYDAVHRYLARRVGTDRADDLAAATFATAFERRGSFRDHLQARPWLFGIATNLLRNEWRTERRALHAVDELTVHAGRRATESAAEPIPIAELLAGLDPDQRDVLVLYAWEGLNYREIAVALDLPVGTVRSRLSRGRTRLREALALLHPSDREKIG